MKNTLRIIHSQSHDPYYNLALEDHLFHQMADDPDRSTQAILYLWQNENTVVIGRNQNAWAECKTELLEAEGGKLARRTTGGGAVFHDLGNLNFSLLLPEKSFDLDRNFQFIVDTVRQAGIPAERSGRNDILAEGQKFSGNAFRINHGIGLHHGTLLIHSAFERVGRYLTVAPAKLAVKGIQSVRSRVTNLAQFRPDLDVAYWMEALESVFTTTFGPAGQAAPARESSADFADDGALKDRELRFRSWAWRFGETLTFDADLEEQTAWGHIHFGFQVEQGRVASVRLFSDALDCDFVAHLEKKLLGQPFSSHQLADLLREEKSATGGFGISRGQMARDLAELVAQQGW